MSRMDQRRRVPPEPGMALVFVMSGRAAEEGRGGRAPRIRGIVCGIALVLCFGNAVQEEIMRGSENSPEYTVFSL